MGKYYNLSVIMLLYLCRKINVQFDSKKLVVEFFEHMYVCVSTITTQPISIYQFCPETTADGHGNNYAVLLLCFCGNRIYIASYLKIICCRFMCIDMRNNILIRIM